MEIIGELTVGALIARDEHNHISDEVLEVCAGNICVTVCWNILFRIY